MRAEYVIAVMLIKKAKIGVSSVSIDELSKYGIYIQRMANLKKLDTVFLMSKPQLLNSIYDFSDYFSYKLDSEGNLSEIYLNFSKDTTDLEFRFMSYIPQKILEILIEKGD